MSDYSAGSAVAAYRLDLTDFRKAAEEVRRFWEEEQRRKSTTSPTVPARPGSTGGGSSSADALVNSQVRAARATGDYTRALQLLDGALDKTSAGSKRYNDLITQRAGLDRQVTNEATRLARAVDQVLTSEIRAARASGDYGRALQLVDTGLGRVSAGTVRYNQLVAQRASIERQAAAETGKTASAFDLLAKGAAAFGIGLGIQQVVQFATQSFALSQQLAQQQRSLQVLTRDQATYNEAISVARQNQALFGGTLAENIDPLRTLVLNAQRYGIELKTLNDLSQRLIVLSPEQGAAGAGVALREALSGDTQSLVERFELPRAELAKIRDTSVSATDKLKILDDVLNAYGVTSQTVKDSVTPLADAQNRLNAEFERLRTSAGEGAAGTIERIYTKLSLLIGLINDNPEALAKMRALFTGTPLEDVDQAAIDQASADITAKRSADNRAAIREQLTSATTSSGVDYTRIGQGGNDFTPERIDRITEALGRAKDVGGEYAKIADDLLRGYQNGSISAADFADRANNLANVLDIVARQTGALVPTSVAAKDSADAFKRGLEEQATALADQITKTQESKDKTDQLAAAQKDLERLAPLVAQGVIDAGAAAAYLANQYGFATDQARGLIDAQNRLATARRNAANAANVQSAQDKINADRASGNTGRGGSSDADELAATYDRIAKERAAAQQAQIEALETTAQKVARLRRELAQLVPGTTAYIEKQTQARLAERQLDAERAAAAKRGATAARTEVNDAQRTADELVRIKRDQLQKLADAEYEYQQKQQRAQEDFAVRQSRSAEDYERQRLRLLADGRRLEAQQLQAEHEREQRREQEDYDRQRRREEEDYQEGRDRTLRDQNERVDDTQDKRDRRSQQRGYGGGGTSTAAATQPPVTRTPPTDAAGATNAATTAALTPRTLQVAFHADVLLDGQKVGELIGPRVVEMVDEALDVELSVLATASAPGLQQPSVREVR